MFTKSKGNLLLTIVILMALSMTVFAFVSLISINLKESGLKVSEYESFYVAEAGLNKAIWYLGTPVASGGRGLAWRTTGSYEAYGWGSYTISVHDTAVSNEVKILSTGEVGGILKHISQVMALGGLPSAFDYAIFANTNINMSGNAAIHGDIFINGNTEFSGSAAVTDGYVYHPTGSTISGSGTYTDGGEPTPVPIFPPLDTSYYDGQIDVAEVHSAGNVTYKNTTVNLGGGTVYVNGDVNISGTTTFNGPGNIVASGSINMSGSTYTNDSVKFISNGSINVSGNAYSTGAIFYSASTITASGNNRMNVGGFISSGNLTLSGNVNVSGIVYAVGQLSLSGNPSVRGTLVSGNLEGVLGISGSTSIIHDESVFPETIPPGFTPTELSRKRGSWSED